MPEDKNKNLIPDRYDRLALRILGVLATLGGGLATYYKARPDGDVPMWLAIGILATGALTGLFAFSNGGGGGE